MQQCAHFIAGLVEGFKLAACVYCHVSTRQAGKKWTVAEWTLMEKVVPVLVDRNIVTAQPNLNSTAVGSDKNKKKGGGWFEI